MRLLALLAVLIGSLTSGHATLGEGAPCARIPRFEGGNAVGDVCEESRDARLAVVDLGDEWVPRILSEIPAHPQSYRETFLALANERIGQGREWEAARRDRYLELYGIFPTLSVIRGRLGDDTRYACHAGIDDGPLRALGRTVTPWSSPATGTAKTIGPALTVVQQHLRCEGLLKGKAAGGTFDGPTQEALRAYQRRHMLPSVGVLDGETRETLLTNSRELDFRTLLRALRERVVDATGLIEDGSATNAWQPILGRHIESSEYRQLLRPQPLPGGAPDLVDRATEAAAIALGWTSPASAQRSLMSPLPARVAVRVPPVPAYHVAPMKLRAEIDRGDVWTSYPLDAEGHHRPSPAKNRATLTLFAQTPEGEIPLVRWPTTIGAWKPEKVDEESEHLRYKPSPVGRRYWRYVLAAPAWFPPPSTPDRELVRRGPAGQWIADEEAVGPGYRSAYGLVALLHDRAVQTAGGGALLVETDIRTHGSGNYRSILRGSSHGCHRLFNHLAIRLGSFLLAHTEYLRQGPTNERYERSVRWRGRAFELRADSRGYRYELRPPVTVDVLPGRTVRSKRVPTTPSGPTPAPSKPQLSSPSGPQV